ncbi:hypothetical protein RJ40_05600 [Methanofollis aquaemaris]|uniref:PGF-pre-PGF domain-containing protein n=1 Tax=Methanofollis aquaemaris TaxID=126734 RepID=A0A8A3S5V5_9EURY|nr:hypothetical protein [Methanofollis aquaemaris]QSZ67004.1 hypothetical protein RJ40_05600 [Methanofollis aquaemaris]
MGRFFRGLVPLLILALVGCALAFPLLPMEFSGTVTIDGKSAPAGTVVTAMINGHACGSAALGEAGIYGGDAVFDSRLNVSGEEGEAGKTITFSVGGTKAQETAVYVPGTAAALDLTVTSGGSSKPSGPGGSGGGGPSGSHRSAPPVQSSAPVMEYTGNAPLDLDSEGAARFRTVVSTSENDANLVIDEGVKALNRFGRPLDSVTVKSVPPDELPSSDDEAVPFGRALKGEPAGATFDPAIEVSITLTPEEWERLAAGEQFVVRWYDSATGTWEALETTVHPSTRTVTAKVSHFTIFAVFARAAPAPIVTSAGQASAAIGADTLPPAPDAAAPAPETGWSSLWLVGLGALAVAGGGVFLLHMKKK